MKQIEICQEENKILDKMHRQKVAEVEKLTQTVHELEEAVLAGGAAANAVHDYQRKVQEMNEEKKTVGTGGGSCKGLWQIRLPLLLQMSGNIPVTK
ncbi:microtubule-associated protein 70-1-like [Prunus avium]|uniref:Microtubule-associated protein 70-1-like n=1 Tax=Prunus avium TaxID=42229 RepID=A0A6P5S379_PRUAV|nr:microtubule-associated protein 70-1-like [Prunus avium]